ncbi:NAD(P)/FAD-dependent oxidoreductase [Pseudoteredinibacter isoporae]|uniref:D-amino-acid dehydrogenase n=1 Tax=Pseudoteredinibacter isoporae TaxID=570281 RepID=A0A7X0MU95_9GAMM|nr:FAD-dependent oxidoreductase [Pseudoteredinibacter isoporae]MBB6520396.1 D-amino-acid dehydrogenase [Pseudoteredinibacter isoporae]NHO85964.1 FAD-binding oxidoreductase [Pseudoteredinibacter isoporae]NIB25584.1 FAD-binding oxidoreductase [Pseudoteredinibacter isoporae]
MAVEKVGILGAGIIGICSAIELQRRGFEVTLLDPKGLGTQASSGNAGHFASEQVFPLADPSLLPQLPKILLDPKGPFRVRPAYFLRALPWFFRFLWNMFPSRSRHNSRLIRQLNERAISSYQELLGHCELEGELHLSGSLLTFESTPESEIKKQQAAFLAEGVAVEYLTRDEALALEPALSDSVSACLYFTEVGHSSDPAVLCRKLADHFLDNGGKFYAMAASELIEFETSVKVRAIKSEQSEQEGGHKDFIFDKILVSSGAWSKPFAKQLGYKVPLDTERGYHLMVPEHKLLSRPVASAERKFIMTPMSDGLRLAGTVEFAGLDAAPDYSRADMLLPHAKALLNVEALQAFDVQAHHERWMGCRPSLPDSVPVMGKAPKHKRVYFNFGHQHLGLTWGAIAGKLLAQNMAGEDSDIELLPYSIARFN